MITLTDQLPQSPEVALEELRTRSDYDDVLRDNGIDVKHVYRAWEPELSDMTLWVAGKEKRAACVIFTSKRDKPRTALVVGGKVVVTDGWKGRPKV